MRKMRSKRPPKPPLPSDRVQSEFAVEVAPASDLPQGKIGLGNSAGSGAYLIIVKRGIFFIERESGRFACRLSGLIVGSVLRYSLSLATRGQTLTERKGEGTSGSDSTQKAVFDSTAEPVATHWLHISFPFSRSPWNGKRYIFPP